MSGPWDNYAQPEAGPWAKYGAPPPAASVTPDNVVRSLASGASFGLADEFAAMMDAATHGVLGRGAAGDTYGQRYDQNLAKERGQDAAFHEAHPYVDTAAKVVGGVGGAAAMLPSAAVSLGPSAIGNVAKAAGVGAGLGAAQGFGEGEGTYDRLARAGIGGTIGGGLGLLARPAAAVGRSISESALGRGIGDNVGAIAAALTGKAAPQGGAETGALTRIADALQRSKMGAGDLEAKLGKLGDSAIPADVSPELLQLAVNAKTQPGETRQIAEDVLKPRIANTGQRMIGAAEGSQRPPSHFQLRGEGQAFDTHAQDVGNVAYGVMNEAGFKNSPGISRMIQENPQIEGAVDRVLASEKGARAGTDRTPASVVDLMHKVKREIQNVGLSANGQPSSTAYYWNQTANDFVKALKTANPTLAEADKAFAQAKSLPELYDQGAALFTKGLGEKATNSSAGGIAEALQGATPNQALAARSGATNAIRDKAQTLTGARGMARDIEFSGGPDGLQGKLAQLYGPEQAAKIIQQSGTEGTFANTSNRLLGGPHTADDLVGASNLGNIAVRATPSGVTPRWTETAKALLNWVGNPNEAVRNEIGRMTINPDAASNKQTVELLAKLLQARARGGQFNAGLAGAAGQQAGGL